MPDPASSEDSSPCAGRLRSPGCRGSSRWRSAPPDGAPPAPGSSLTRETGADAGPAAAAPVPARRTALAWWVAAALAGLLAWTVLTWPFTSRLDDSFWVSIFAGSRPVASEVRTLSGGDHLQTLFIQRVVIENVTELRLPYLDLREGVAGPTPLRTTSLDVPWTALVALLDPLTGPVAAYNSTLLLSSVATVLAAFGLLRRHTRWPLLALAGALAYTFSQPRLYHLTGHFNAVMWWAFPAAAWAFEATMERHRTGRRWVWPALALVAVVGVVALSGEYHLILYLTALLAFLAAWQLGAALLRHEPVPLAPMAVVLGSLALADAYVVAIFHEVFSGGAVAGNDGAYSEVVRYAPRSVLSMVRKDARGDLDGERLVYLGWGVAVPALAGLVIAVLRRRSALPYAVLSVPLLVLTNGPAADVGGFRPYRFLFDHVPFVALQRSSGRLFAVTGLMAVLLAVVAVDALTARLAREPETRGTPGMPGIPGALGTLGTAESVTRGLAAVVLVAATVLLLADHRPPDNAVEPAYQRNRVIQALGRPGPGAQGPILGLPVVRRTLPWNAVTTYAASLSRRSTLNAYNQTPAPWLDERVAALRPLTDGRTSKAALDVLRQTGTRQVLVVNEPHIYRPGQWQATIDRLVASGSFRLELMEAPFALLEFRG